ncbi:MAG TPA: PASTA domain-containing protein [Clostridia bacterium]
MPENKSFLDTIAESVKPESFRQENFVAVQNRSNRTKAIVVIIAIAVVLAGIFAVYYFTNNVRVPELSGMTLDEASAWAAKNRIILSAKSVYNFKTDTGNVISQEVAAGNSIQKNSALVIEVSLGANPEEMITWPDIKTMTKSDIEAWISANKLTGVKITTANSDVVAANQVISYTLTDDTEANFKRKSRATISVSIGPATQSETVVVSDFSTMKAGAVLSWGNDNNIAIQLTEAFDDYIASGSVISQSVKATTEVKKGSSISVVISKGKPITVIDLSVITQAEANAWAKLNSVTLTIKETYSSVDDAGKLVSQGIAAGASMKAGEELKLIYSLGRIDVSSYIGKTKLDILNWQKTVNDKGGNITLTFSEAYGDKGTAGKITVQSIKNDYVVPGTKISIVVSLGMRILAPDFAGKTVAECNALGQANGVTVLYDYQASTTVGNGLAISQNPAKNTVMTDAGTITVVISVSGIAQATVAVPDFGPKSKDEANAWAKSGSITLVYVDQYSNNTPKGMLFGQSVAAGQMAAPGLTITIYNSLGLVDVSSFVSKTKLDMLNWLAGVNAKGANISAAYTYANNMSYAMNLVIGQSIMNTFIETGSTITFNISWDPVITAPTPSPTPTPAPTPTP